MPQSKPVITLYAEQELSGIEITDKKFMRMSTMETLTGVVSNPLLGYYKSMCCLKQFGHDINQYCELKLMELNPKIFKPLT